MERAEEHNFRLDVYTHMMRSFNYLATGFIVGEREKRKDDSVFFSELLNPNGDFLQKARDRGVYYSYRVEPFVLAFRKIVNDDLAYRVFRYQDEVESYSTTLLSSMSNADVRSYNAFKKYWRDKCAHSVKFLYYRLLMTDPNEPKYDSLGKESSKELYSRLLEFKAKVDSFLLSKGAEEQKPTLVEPSSGGTDYVSVTKPFDIKDSDSIPFLNYVYDKVVSEEFPASAIMLSVLRARSSSELDFYKAILEMDVQKARRLLGIGEVSAKEVNQMCEMMRRITAHPGSKVVFENREKADILAPRIKKRLEYEDVRTYHAYQKFMEGCGDSVLTLYLRVIGLPPHRVKVPGLNTKKSLALFDFLREVLPMVDKFILAQPDKPTSATPVSPSSEKVQEEISLSTPSLLYKPGLHQFDFSDEEIETIVKINDNIGHFPLFTAISFVFDKMEERRKAIARRTLNIIKGAPVEDLTEVSTSLGLSRERVRQLRDTCLKEILTYPRMIERAGLVDQYLYPTQSEYDFKLIRELENVDFSDEFITVCIPIAYKSLRLIGEAKSVLLKSSSQSRRVYVVPADLHSIFSFDKFIQSVEGMISEKRFYPYRDDLETYIKSLLKDELSNEDFYAVVKECRQILQKGYPENIINSQIYFPVNARKTIPNLIEDILREFNRPMTAEDICEELNKRFPELEQIPSKIGANALRNSNIVAVSRSSTYALAEWNYTEKRGGTIRDLAVEYLNSLIQPIAPLSDICDYIAKFREGVKESSVKANLLAESNNKFGLYYKGDILHIGFTEYSYGDEFVLQEKRQGRRPFKDSIERLERFIKANDRFPFTAGVEGEEARLSRFYSVAKGNQKKGTLSPEELAELERIDETYGHLRVKKERVSWDERLERFAKHITENESLPYPSSKEYAWFEENKALYDAGELEPVRAQSFAFLLKIMRRMNLL